MAGSDFIRGRTIVEITTDLVHICVALCIPLAFFSKRAYVTCTLVGVGFFFISIIAKRKWPDLTNVFVILVFGYFILQVVSLLWTSNIKRGFSELDTVSAILAFPTLLFLSGNARAGIVKFGFSMIVATASFAGLAMYFMASKNVLETGQPLSVLFSSPHYRYVELSAYINIHPSYLSVLLMGAIIVIVIHIGHGSSRARKIAYSCLIAYLLFLLFMLMSRGPWIGFVAATGLTAAAFLRHRKYIFILAVALFVLAALILGVSPLRARFIDPILNFDQQRDLSVTYHWNSWQCSLELAQTPRAILIGHGVGDEIDKLVGCYQAHGYDSMVTERFNAHNAYLSQFVKNGLLGAVFLIMMIGVFLYEAYRKRNIAAFFFVVLLSVAFLFESFLNVRLGVFFFSCFVSFFLRFGNYRVAQTEPDTNVVE